MQPVGIVGPDIERAQPGGQVHFAVCFSSQRRVTPDESPEWRWMWLWVTGPERWRPSTTCVGPMRCVRRSPSGRGVP